MKDVVFVFFDDEQLEVLQQSEIVKFIGLLMLRRNYEELWFDVQIALRISLDLHLKLSPGEVFFSVDI